MAETLERLVTPLGRLIADVADVRLGPKDSMTISFSKNRSSFSLFKTALTAGIDYIHTDFRCVSLPFLFYFRLDTPTYLSQNKSEIYQLAYMAHLNI